MLVRVVSSSERLAEVLAVLARGDRATVRTHAHEPCAAQRARGLSGRAGAMRVRSLLGAVQRCVNSAAADGVF